MNKFILNLSRFLLFILIIFEYLNHIKILHFKLEFTWIGLIITVSVIWITLELIFLWMRKKCGYINYGYLLFIVAAGVYVDSFGDIFFLYNRYCWYDQAAHFAGGAVAGIIIFQIIKALNDCRKISLSYFSSAFFSLMSAGFAGMLYEIEEYLEDFYTGSHRLGNGFDTANDLMTGILGALAVIIFISAYLQYKRKKVKK